MASIILSSASITSSICRTRLPANTDVESEEECKWQSNVRTVRTRTTQSDEGNLPRKGYKPDIAREIARKGQNNLWICLGNTRMLEKESRAVIRLEPWHCQDGSSRSAHTKPGQFVSFSQMTDCLPSRRCTVDEHHYSCYSSLWAVNFWENKFTGSCREIAINLS